MKYAGKCKFDYAEFGRNIGDCEQIVFHANKYSKEDVIKIFNEQYKHTGLVATIDDITQGFIRWFIHPTEFMSSEYSGGCYGFVDKPGIGVITVYVLDLANMANREGYNEA